MHRMVIDLFDFSPFTSGSILILYIHVYIVIWPPGHGASDGKFGTYYMAIEDRACLAVSRRGIQRSMREPSNAR